MIRQVSTDRWTQIRWYGFFMLLSFLIGLIVCRRRQAFSRFRAIDWIVVIAAAILDVGNIIFMSAITFTTIANTVIFVNSTSLVVALMSWQVLRETVPGRSWIAILVGLGGAAVIEALSLNSLSGWKNSWDI